MTKVLYPLFLSVLLAFTHCKKTDPVTRPPDKDELPAATQEGKMTIGCMLNDTVLIPKGYTGRNNPSIHYDPTYAGGDLNITMYNIDKSDSVRQYLIIGAKNISKTGTYPITSPHQDVGIQYSKLYVKTNSGCEYKFGEEENSQSGELVITRLDITEKIIAGTFSFTLAKKDCDTLTFSQGRFDLKF